MPTTTIVCLISGIWTVYELLNGATFDPSTTEMALQEYGPIADSSACPPRYSEVEASSIWPSWKESSQEAKELDFHCHMPEALNTLSAHLKLVSALPTRSQLGQNAFCRYQNSQQDCNLQKPHVESLVQLATLTLQVQLATEAARQVKLVHPQAGPLTRIM